MSNYTLATRTTTPSATLTGAGLGATLTFLSTSKLTTNIQGPSGTQVQTVYDVVYEVEEVVNNGTTAILSSWPIATVPASAKPSKGASTGAIAGAAVGCLFGGLILGLAATFFFFRWRRSRAPTPVVYSSPEEPKHYLQSTMVPTPPPDAPQLNQFLLDALPDNDLASELRSSGQLIEAHSERNYHLEPVQVHPQGLSQALANLGIGGRGSLSADDVAGLALNPQTRQIAIRHVLAHVLYTSIDFSSRSRLTMLPAPIAGFLQSIPPVERNGGNKDAYSAALSRWRALGAFLLHPQRSLRAPLTPNEDAIAPQAASLVNALNSFLDPFVPADHKQQQANHLQLVIMECTKFGYVLFSQPSDWRLTLSSGNAHRMAVVCAGLEKTSDKNGNPHAFPHSVLAPTLVQV